MYEKFSCPYIGLSPKPLLLLLPFLGMREEKSDFSKTPSWPSLGKIMKQLKFVFLSCAFSLELGQTPGDGERQGGLACYSPWGLQRVGHNFSN